MRINWLRWVAVVVGAVALGFLIGTWRTGARTETGQAHSTGAGGGSIVTSGWTYGFASDVAWTDANNSRHEGGTPDCLPPLSIKDGVKFAWIEVTVDGSTWRPVVWIDCRGVTAP
jgi:hypothetical protein